MSLQYEIEVPNRVKCNHLKSPLTVTLEESVQCAGNDLTSFPDITHMQRHLTSN